MSATPTEFSPPDAHISLKGVEWLADERLQRLMQVIAGPDEDIRIVGGAVRNTLMGREVADVDLATTAMPQTVMTRARQPGMKPVPTGLDHGTVTVVVDGKPFEVTTLRQDVATDGRRATVRFGRDWVADARRRDFTVNALYATASGAIIDLVGGIADCAARRIRFIGDADARIREDYLRILRLFRFHAAFSDGPIDPKDLAAAVRLREGILSLSAERIGQELLKLVVADHAPDVLRVMRDTGILSLTLATDAIDVDRFSRLHALVAPLQTRPAALLLAGLAGNGTAGFEHLAKRLRLSNAIRDRMLAAWSATTLLTPDMSERDARAAIFRVGADAYRDAVLLSASAPDNRWSSQHVAELLRLGQIYSPPRLPISGRDLLSLGLAPGPDLGKTLNTLAELWINSDFALTKQDLMAQVRQPKT
jgi:poly(A) polymerase